MANRLQRLACYIIAIVALPTTPCRAGETNWRPAGSKPATADRYVTELRPVERRYWAPVTEMRWVVVWRGGLPPLWPARPVYELQPVTRWEQRVDKVRIAVTRKEQVPSENARLASTTPPVLSPTPQPPAATGPVGGVGRMESDPPRYGWRSAAGTALR